MAGEFESGGKVTERGQEEKCHVEQDSSSARKPVGVLKTARPVADGSTRTAVIKRVQVMLVMACFFVGTYIHSPPSVYMPILESSNDAAYSGAQTIGVVALDKQQIERRIQRRGATHTIKMTQSVPSSTQRLTPRKPLLQRNFHNENAAVDRRNPEESGPAESKNGKPKVKRGAADNASSPSPKRRAADVHPSSVLSVRVRTNTQSHRKTHTHTHSYSEPFRHRFSHSFSCFLLAYRHSHPLWHFRTRVHAPSLPPFLSLSLSLSPSLSLCRSLPVRLSLTHSLTHSQSPSLPLSLSFPPSPPLPLPLFLPLIHKLSLIHSLPGSLPGSHSLTYRVSEYLSS